MLTLITTDSYMPSERLPIWRSFLSRVCGNFDVEQIGRDDFSGAIATATLGGLSYKTICGTDSRIVRSRREAWRYGLGNFYFIVQLDGITELRQCGGEAILHPGEAALIDGNQASEFVFLKGCRELVLHIPSSLLDAYCRGRPARVATKIQSSGYAKALVSLLLTAADQIDYFDGNSSRLIADQILNGVAHLVCREKADETEPGRRFSSYTLENVKQLIARSLADPELTITRVASLAGMSSRKLQRLFQASGVTYGEWLRCERLRHCYFELVSSRDQNVSITDLAFRWGFSDVSHFSRAFRAQFGVCARDVRARSLAGPAPTTTSTAILPREFSLAVT
jgi:AraC family transcriptional regulator, positive regulator of tynA and feaB